MESGTGEIVRATLTESQQEALTSFHALLTSHGGTPQRMIVVDAEGQQIEVPQATLGELLPAVAVATRILTTDDDRELTTTAAARWLQVSRQHLVDLLKAELLPHRMVGAHRRVRLGDLRAYKARQRATLREISQLSEDLGYDE